jgi:hypothetical protein
MSYHKLTRVRCAARPGTLEAGEESAVIARTASSHARRSTARREYRTLGSPLSASTPRHACRGKTTRAAHVSG